MKNTIDPENWVKNYGDILYRYCLARVNNPETAEELVQETFFAGIKDKNKFQGKSTESTWLIGILKHKIIDHYRSSKKNINSYSSLNEDVEEQDRVFNKVSHLNKSLHNWPETPETMVENKEFLAQLNECVSKLPERPRQVYILKELDKLTSKEICKHLNITPTNLWVLLHRAREKLRRCLEINWFEKE